MDERTILSLLTENNHLSDIISKQEFTKLFPADKRSDIAVDSLFHDLSDVRTRQLKVVEKNIELECEVSNQTLKHSEGDESGVSEDESDSRNIYSELLESKDTSELSLQDLIASMERAVERMASELDMLDRSCDEMLLKSTEIVDSLSDLRYKKLAANTKEECLKGLQVILI
ncbi:hypothetical protein V1511DRAFT_506099 [Dipodascopsis uninucleata]